MTVLILSSMSWMAGQPAAASAHGLMYLDPGSGSILLQLALAALLGVAVVVRAFWNKIKAFFARLAGRSGKEPGDGK